MKWNFERLFLAFSKKIVQNLFKIFHDSFTIDLTDIKKEPVEERPKWRLVAVSQAARKHRNIIVLEPKSYTLGRSRKTDIQIASPFCSNMHCELVVSEMEVIMRDEVSVRTSTFSLT